MSLTLEEYREILSWYAKKTYYEQKYKNHAPLADSQFVSSIHRKLRESVKKDEE